MLQDDADAEQILSLNGLFISLTLKAIIILMLVFANTTTKVQKANIILIFF